MKKFTFLVALAVATMATAQTPIVDDVNSMSFKKMNFSVVEPEGEFQVIPFTAETYAQKTVAEGAYAAADYYYATGMMHIGMSPEGYGLTMPLLLLPYQDSVVWKNLYGPTSWYSQANDKLLAENSETMTQYGMVDYGMGSYYLHYTTDHTLNLQGTDYLIKGYMYAEAKGKGGAAVGYGETRVVIDNNGTLLYFPMTLCGMETSTLYEEDGNDFYQVGTKNTRGMYKHGTGLHVDEAKTQRVDTMGQIVRNVSPMNIYQIFIPIYNQSSKDINGMLPEGAEVKVEILAADLTQGLIYTDSVLAETVVTAADFVQMGSTGTYGTLVAKFWEEDILGGIYETSVLVEGDFYLQLTNYNETNCEFGIFSDYHTPGGTTLYVKDGKFVEISINGDHNLAIGYDAYWPAIANDTTVHVMNAPVEGGIAHYGDDTEDYTITLWTNVTDIELWGIDAPEWIEFGYSDQYLASNSALLAMFQAAALPEGETGRQGVVTFYADGASYSITINQGEVVNTGVENVTAPVFNGKIYNLLGVEVDENYKGIVIKNGQKYIQ